MKSDFSSSIILGVKYLTIIFLLCIICCQKNINHSNSTKPDSNLKNTYWKILSIDNRKIVMPENQRELHFVLKLDSDDVQGHSGCNTFNGKYKLSGSNGIEFFKMISTRMYCPDYQGEPLWFDFIEGPMTYMIKGEELILTNKKKIKARCQAIYLK